MPPDADILRLLGEIRERDVDGSLRTLLQPGGAPWESYVTDPADFPNPDDWRTEIYWPLSD
jgi:hypothetical protein